MKSASNSMDDAFLVIKTLLVQLYLDKEISVLRNSSQPDQLDIIKAYNGLGLYTSILPYIKSIYVYSDLTDKFYISLANGTKRTVEGYNFYDTFARTMLQMPPQEYSLISPVSRVIPLSGSSGEIAEFNGFTYMYRYFPEGSETYEGAIFINVSDEWIKNALSKADSQFDNKTYIFNKTGNIMYNSDYGITPNYQPVSSETVYEIQNKKDSYGCFVDVIDNQQSLIIYSEYNHLSWTMIKVISMDDIMKEVYSVRNLALMLASSVLILGGLTALFVSKNMYKPIGKIVRRLSNLEKENTKVLLLKKNELLKKILLSELLPDSETQASINSLGIKFVSEESFVLLYMMIDHIKQFISSSNAEDREQINKILMSITLDICRGYYPSEFLNWADGDAVVILCISKDQKSEHSKTLSTIINSVKNAAGTATGLSISFAISSVGAALSSLPHLYDEVREIAFGRYFSGPNCVLTHEQPQRIKYNEYRYPVDSEMKLTKLLLSGDIDGAREVFDDIIKDCKKYTYYTVQHELMRLVSASFTALNLIEENKGIKFSYSFDRFMSDVLNMETLREATDYFNRFYDALEYTLDESKTNKQQKMISRAQEMVREKYQSYSLSLNSIAGDLGISSVYLGRAYKKITNQSLPDFINSYRIEKAKEMLENTSKTIKSIAVSTGYVSNQSFYRVFKKLCGVTPLEYRISIKSKITIN